MAKSKAEYWLTDDGLLLLNAWARDGLTDEIIAAQMRISTSTLYCYKNQYPVISEALKKGKEIIDIQVENALLKKALEGDLGAMIFWLKNRKPDKWRDKQPEPDNSEETIANVSNVLVAIRKAAQELKHD